MADHIQVDVEHALYNSIGQGRQFEIVADIRSSGRCAVSGTSPRWPWSVAAG